MQSKTIDIKTESVNLQDLLSIIREGEEVLLVDGDTALARLIPIESTKQTRIMGLHAHLGTAWMSNDFDEPLSDAYWLGEE